ncbi:MAG: hypothetical protein Ct9H90mP13_03350 [Pseudomonadota bacterium]|nr:MAG: hypothetical protein Ct9H90mP13_03350 [Pseudomonadota bacterium]
MGVPFARDMTKYHDDFTDEGKIKSVKDVIQFLLDNTTGIQNVKYEELAAKGFLRNKGSETTLHSKESPFFSEIYDNVREKTGYKTLTHRQQFYIDHDWFVKFDEALPGHKDALINEGYPMKMLMGHARQVSTACGVMIASFSAYKEESLMSMSIQKMQILRVLRMAS